MDLIACGFFSGHGLQQQFLTVVGTAYMGGFSVYMTIIPRSICWYIRKIEVPKSVYETAKNGTERQEHGNISLG